MNPQYDKLCWPRRRHFLQGAAIGLGAAALSTI